MNNYEDIINLNHHVSATRTPMPMYKRAAQFAPFAALTGYDDAIVETSRVTDKKITMDEESINSLNNNLLIIKDNIKLKPLVSITYFLKDKKKSGGKYITIKDNIKKIDDVYKLIYTNNYKIDLYDIQKIEIINDKI